MEIDKIFEVMVQNGVIRLKSYVQNRVIRCKSYVQNGVIQCKCYSISGLRWVSSKNYYLIWVANQIPVFK